MVIQHRGAIIIMGYLLIVRMIVVGRIKSEIKNQRIPWFSRLDFRGFKKAIQNCLAYFQSGDDELKLILLKKVTLKSLV